MVEDGLIESPPGDQLASLGFRHHHSLPRNTEGSGSPMSGPRGKKGNGYHHWPGNDIFPIPDITNPPTVLLVHLKCTAIPNLNQIN